jgi:hypothetical protein
MSRIPHERSRWSLLALSLAVLAATLCPAGSQAAERTLRWKFKAGDSLGCVIDQQMVQTLKIANEDVKITISQLIDLRWDVKDVSSDGVASMTQTIDKIRMKVETPQGVAIDYDTSSGKDPEGQAAMLTPMFKALVKQPMTYNMSSSGVITDLQLPKEMIDGFKKVPGIERMGGMFSEDGMKQMISQGALTLPAESIDVGKTWQNEAVVDQGPLGKMKSTTVYKYAGVEMHDGKEMDKIESTVTLEYPDADKAEAKVELTEQEGKGTIYFDNSIGRVSDSTAKSKMKMTVTVLGMKVDTVNDMTMTMKYGPAPAVKKAAAE